jgi:outer membrane protein assembly factor BamB
MPENGIESQLLPESHLVIASDWHGTVYAVDAATGGLYWSTSTEHNFPLSISVYQDMVLAATSGPNDNIPCLSAFDISTGEKKWTFNANCRIVSGPCRANSTVYIGDKQGSLFAVDATTGKIKQHAGYPDAIYTIAYAPEQEMIYAKVKNNGLYSFDLANEDHKHIASGLNNILYHRGILYVSTEECLQFLRPGTTTVRHFPNEEDQHIGESADPKFLAAENNNIYATSPSDGVLLQKPTIDSDGPSWSISHDHVISRRPIVGPKYSYIQSEKQIFAYRHDNSITKWKKEVPNSVKKSLGTLSPCGSILYIRTGNGCIRALDAESGNNVWSVQNNEQWGFSIESSRRFYRITISPLFPHLN